MEISEILDTPFRHGEILDSDDPQKAEIGARTLPLNPGHNPSLEDLGRGRGFIDIMKDNLKSLLDGCQER